MKNRINTLILLAAPTGLMFCIVPIGGFEFRLSWQLAAIWGGGTNDGVDATSDRARSVLDPLGHEPEEPVLN